MYLKKLKRKLVSYIKFRELAKSIKLVALSQLSNLKKKINTKGIPLSLVMPFYYKKYYNTSDFNRCLLIPAVVENSFRVLHSNIKRYYSFLSNNGDSSNNSNFDELNVKKNIELIKFYYETSYEREYNGDFFFFENYREYGDKNNVLSNMPRKIELLNQLKFNSYNNKYKYLYIKLDRFFESYKSSQNIVEADIINELLISLISKYKIYFSFFDYILFFLSSKDITDDQNVNLEWLICISSEDIDMVYREVLEFNLVNDFKMIIEIHSDGNVFFEKKHLIDKSNNGHSGMGNYLGGYFVIFNYEKELEDYYFLGYYSEKADYGSDKMEIFIDICRNYLEENFINEQNSAEDYDVLVFKKIQDYPDFVREHYVYIPRSENGNKYFQMSVIGLWSLAYLKSELINSGKANYIVYKIAKNICDSNESFLYKMRYDKFSIKDASIFSEENLNNFYNFREITEHFKKLGLINNEQYLMHISKLGVIYRDFFYNSSRYGIFKNDEMSIIMINGFKDINPYFVPFANLRAELLDNINLNDILVINNIKACVGDRIHNFQENRRVEFASEAISGHVSMNMNGKWHANTSKNFTMLEEELFSGNVRNSVFFKNIIKTIKENLNSYNLLKFNAQGNAFFFFPTIDLSTGNNNGLPKNFISCVTHNIKMNTIPLPHKILSFKEGDELSINEMSVLYNKFCCVQASSNILKSIKDDAYNLSKLEQIGQYGVFKVLDEKLNNMNISRKVGASLNDLVTLLNEYDN